MMNQRPTPTCMWCPEADYAGTDYDPCVSCKAQWDQGVCMMLAETEDGVQRPLGPHWVVSEDAFTQVFTGAEAEEGLRKRRLYINRETAVRLGLIGDFEALT